MKPSARIELNGKDVSAKWADVLESLTITDEAGFKSDTCEIAFDNSKGFSAPPIGAELKVWLGYEPDPIYIGSYKVDEWTKRGPLMRLAISAKAADLTSEIRAPKVRSFDGKSVKQIVEQVAADHRLKAVVDATIGACSIDHIDQQTESDLAFLSRLAKRQGATFKLADGKILFAAKGSSSAPSGSEKKTIELEPGQVSEWEATCSKRGEYGSASAIYMDRVAKKRKSVKVGTKDPCHRDRRLYGSEPEARAAANATFGDLTRGQIAVNLTLGGDPSFFAEAVVRLKGFDADVDGELIAKTVTHEYGRGGFVTRLDLETKGASEEDAG